jgi:hypothetical protein
MGKALQMSRTIVAGIVASTLALGFAACGTEVEEQGSAAKPNEKAALSEVEEQGSAETPAPPGVAEALREEQKANPPSEEELAQTDELIPPEVIIDYMFKSNSFKQQFCGRYEALGYEAALRSFASEIGQEPAFPPPRVLFEEAISRC